MTKEIIKEIDEFRLELNFLKKKAEIIYNQLLQDIFNNNRSKISKITSGSDTILFYDLTGNVIFNDYFGLDGYKELYDFMMEFGNIFNLRQKSIRITKMN